MLTMLTASTQLLLYMFSPTVLTTNRLMLPAPVVAAAHATYVYVQDTTGTSHYHTHLVAVYIPRQPLDTT